MPCASRSPLGLSGARRPAPSSVTRCAVRPGQQGLPGRGEVAAVDRRRRRGPRTGRGCHAAPPRPASPRPPRAVRSFCASSSRPCVRLARGPGPLRRRRRRPRGFSSAASTSASWRRGSQLGGQLRSLACRRRPRPRLRAAAAACRVGVCLARRRDLRTSPSSPRYGRRRGRPAPRGAAGRGPAGGTPGTARPRPGRRPARPRGGPGRRRSARSPPRRVPPRPRRTPPRPAVRPPPRSRPTTAAAPAGRRALAEAGVRVAPAGQLGLLRQVGTLGLRLRLGLLGRGPLAPHAGWISLVRVREAGGQVDHVTRPAQRRRGPRAVPATASAAALASVHLVADVGHLLDGLVHRRDERVESGDSLLGGRDHLVGDRAQLVQLLLGHVELVPRRAWPVRGHAGRRPRTPRRPAAGSAGPAGRSAWPAGTRRTGPAAAPRTG